MIDTQLSGKVALVTGANNPYGIGTAVCKALANQGCKLFIQYFRPAAADAEALVAEPLAPGEAFYLAQQAKSVDSKRFGVEAAAMEADLSDPHAVKLLFEAAERTVGPVDILVNNAAHWQADSFIPADMSLRNQLVELWTSRPPVLSAQTVDSIFAVNTRAVALMMVEYTRKFLNRGAKSGRIINISSDGAHSFPSEVSYGASKLALEGYTRSAAAELGQFGITVNTVSLGPIQTGWITAELEKQIIPTIPLGRVGMPEDVADVVVFVASDQARFISGQTIRAGGGGVV